MLKAKRASEVSKYHLSLAIYVFVDAVKLVCKQMALMCCLSRFVSSETNMSTTIFMICSKRFYVQ